MSFEDIEMELPKSYPPNILDDKIQFIYYTKGNWQCDCFNNNFFDFLSKEQLDERYKQVLRNYNIFVNSKNDVLPIDNIYSSWYWSKVLYQLKVIYSFRGINEPIVDFGYTIHTTYKTHYKPKIFRLFRFCELEYNLDFLVNGNIRFSAAGKYKDDENEARCDNEMEKSFIYSGLGSKIITMDGKEIPCLGEGKTSFPAYDYYMACFSIQYNPVFYKEMSNYDSCVVIHDVPEFCRRIQGAFKNQYSLSEINILASNVGYYDKFSKIDGLKKKLVPYFEKDISYAWEEEFRFIAFPDNFSEPYLYLSIGSLKDIAEILIVKNRSEAEEIIQKYLPNTVYKNGKYI